MGQFLLTKHKDNPRKVWLQHRIHQCNSEYSMRFAQKLLVKIYGLQIKNFPTRLDFLTEWSNLVADHADISEGLNDSTLSKILQIAVRLDPVMMTMFSNFFSLRKLQNKPENDIPYEELFNRVQTDFLRILPSIVLSRHFRILLIL